MVENSYNITKYTLRCCAAHHLSCSKTFLLSRFHVVVCRPFTKRAVINDPLPVSGGGPWQWEERYICAVYTSFAHLCCHFQVLKCYRLLHRACRKAFQGDHVTLQGIYSIQYKNTSKIAALCTCTCSCGAIVEYNNIMQLPESDWRKNFGKIVMSLIQSSCQRYRYHVPILWVTEY